MPPENHSLNVLSSQSIPTVAEVDRIAALTNPVIRNLQITQCYCELSAAFAVRDGSGANWCTFATWASKQAGQSIRREDLKRTLEALLKREPEIDQALSLIATLSRQLGAHQTFEHIRQSALGGIVDVAAERASNAVSRGNKKVFEEIAREFARFIDACLRDTTFTASHIDEFCQQLRPGPHPKGRIICAWLLPAITKRCLKPTRRSARKGDSWRTCRLGFMNKHDCSQRLPNRLMLRQSIPN